MSRARARAPESAPEPIRLQPIDHRLVDVAPGPDPFLSDTAAALLEEWISGWLAEPALAAASIPAPGPMLLHGAPGTGKTTTARAIARRFAEHRRAVALDAHRVTEQYMGATGANLAHAIDAAQRARAVLVIEEADALANRRSFASGAEAEGARTTIALMRLIESPAIPIVLTTNRLDALDPAVVRRCEYVVEMPEPSPARKLEIVARELGASPGCDVDHVDLVVAIPIARRARRLAALSGRAAAHVFMDLLPQPRAF